MSTSPQTIPAEIGAQPVCLALESDPVLAFFHPVTSERHKDTAVLMCPPFGWDEMCSHRGRVRWASAFAAAGYPVARIDLPGSGDSGGMAGESGGLEAWVRSVRDSAHWLKQRTGCTRVAGCGIGLGGLLLLLAVAEGAPIEDLILWAVPSSGRRLLQQLRAQAGMIAARFPDDSRGQGEQSSLELTGFLLDPAVPSQLESLRLEQLELPALENRRVLLLGRDRLGVEKRLQAHLDQSGAEVTVSDGDEYEQLMAEPQSSQTPLRTIETSVEWLEQRSQSLVAPEQAVPSIERDVMELEWKGARVRERPMFFDLPGGRAFGILSEPIGEPLAPLTVVLLNAGALRHTGPNRTWVEIGRDWAARGVSTVRVDLQGIGEADGDERALVPNRSLYAPHAIAETLGLLDQLADRGLPDRFVLGGLCSGAYWALHAARADSRVRGILMINLYSFFWSPELVVEREPKEAISGLHMAGLRRLLRGEVSVDRMRTVLRSMAELRLRSKSLHRVEEAQREQIEQTLDRLRDQGTEALLLLGRGELLLEQMERQGFIAQLDRWPNLKLARIPSRDHMFRAVWLQEHVQAQLDQALDRVLAAVA